MLQKSLNLVKQSRRVFSYNHNFHNPAYFYVNGIKYTEDYDIEEYEPAVKAFLTKRWPTKREVPAKIAILEDMGENYRQVYYQQRLAYGEVLYDDRTQKRLYDVDGVNSQFLHSMWCEEYQKNMLDEITKKRVINGSVPLMADTPKKDEIDKEIDYWQHVFYHGQPLSVFEKDVQRIYLSQKVLKHTKYEKRKSMRYKVKWTVSDLNKMQGQINYRMNDPEYFGTARPYFDTFDLDAAMKCMHMHHDIQQAGYLRRGMSWFTDTKVFERGSKRSEMQADNLMTRFMLYQDSYEFVESLSLKEDFHIHNSIANMHVWLLYQRLRDFSENKFAFQLREELILRFNKFITAEMEDVQVLRKFKKIEDIENYLFSIRRNLDFHFYINGATTYDNTYKLDALVWTCIFHEKVPRYSNQVYRMCHYLLHHFQYLKTLDYYEIEKGLVEWSVNRIPFNARESFTRLSANRPLSEEEFMKEKESPYKTKKYHYNYRHPEELSEENLQRTYVNMCTNAFIQNKDKTVREENLNLDNMNSKEKDEQMFRMKMELERLSQLADEDQTFFSNLGQASPLKTQYNLWKKNLFIPLTDQLEEQAQRKIDKMERKKYEDTMKDQAFFVKDDADQLHDIDAQKSKTNRMQAILRQKIAKEKGIDIEDPDADAAKATAADENQNDGNPYRDTVDNLPVKRKQKWRLW